MSNAKLKLLIISNLITGVIAIAALVMVVIQKKHCPQIAYVNNAKVLSEFQGVKESTSQYQAMMQLSQANLDTLEREVDREIALYQKVASTIPPRERALREQIIGQKKENYFNYKQAIDEKLQKEDERLTAAVLNQIDSYLLEYGESHPYDFIVGINEQGNLLYGRDENDITDEVLAGLNNTYAGE